MKTNRSGQALVEYALILALIAIIAIPTLRGLGQSVNARLQDINSNLQGGK
jgi:Flp pilus assembly pilin Flp